jgi:hypothetical protein
MTLQGSLDTFSIPDVLALLAQTRKTGALHVRGDRGRGVLYFTGGLVCGAEAGDDSGPVAEDGFDERLADVTFELLRNASGSFEFEPDASPVWPAAGEADVTTLVSEAAARLEEWRMIELVIPSMEARPRLVDQLPAETVTIDRPRWRVLTAVDGRRRVSVIARVLEMSEFHLCRTLKLLVDAGIVELDGEARPVSGDAPIDDDLPVLAAAPAPAVQHDVDPLGPPTVAAPYAGGTTDESALLRLLASNDS